MPRQKRPTGKRSKKGFVLGHAGFAKISAVSIEAGHEKACVRRQQRGPFP
jgi:hypothetical protein